MNSDGTRVAYLLLGAVILLWGVNWPIMKVGLEHIPPLWFAAARALLGSACLFALLAVTGRVRFPGRRDLPLMFTIGFLQVTMGLALIHFALQYVEAGRSAILAYTFPLWVAPLAVLFLGEKMNLPRLGGLVLGLLGVGVMFDPSLVDISDPDLRLGNGLLLLAAMIWAVVVVHVRGSRAETPPIMLMPWQLLLGGLLLAGLAFSVEGAPRLEASTELLLVLAYNGPVASAFCFWAYVSVARRLPAMSTALGSLGVPVAGVTSSAIALGEPLAGSTLLGLALISGGVVLVSLADLRTCKQPRQSP